jgi:hypothetical protein
VGEGAYVTAAETSETRDDRHARILITAAADDLLSGYASMLTIVFSKQRQPRGERGHQGIVRIVRAALLAKERARLAAINPRHNPATGVSS